MSIVLCFYWYAVAAVVAADAAVEDLWVDQANLE